MTLTNNSPGYALTRKRKPAMRIKQLPGYSKYCVSDCGMIFELKNGRQLKQELSYKGYPVVTLYSDQLIRKTMPVHRIVMHVFAGESRLTVNHKDGNKLNNHISNLEYLTAADNLKHSNEVLHTIRGHKLTGVEVLEIKEKLKLGVFQRTIAKEYNVHQGTIHNINVGTTWKHIQ